MFVFQIHMGLNVRWISQHGFPFFPCFSLPDLCVPSLSSWKWRPFQPTQKETNHRVPTHPFSGCKLATLVAVGGLLGGSPPFYWRHKYRAHLRKWNNPTPGIVGTCESVGWCSVKPPGISTIANLYRWSSPISGCHQRRMLKVAALGPPKPWKMKVWNFKPPIYGL